MPDKIGLAKRDNLMNLRLNSYLFCPFVTHLTKWISTTMSTVTITTSKSETIFASDCLSTITPTTSRTRSAWLPINHDYSPTQISQYKN